MLIMNPSFLISKTQTKHSMRIRRMPIQQKIPLPACLLRKSHKSCFTSFFSIPKLSASLIITPVASYSITPNSSNILSE